VPGEDTFQRAVTWQNGEIHDLGMFPHATTGYDDVEATNINDQGLIIGFAGCHCSLPAQAWSLSNGVVTVLPTLGGRGAEAWGVNASGQIVGAADTTTVGVTHATLWQNGAVSDLGALPSGGFSEAVSINASGVAVGFSTLIAGGALGDRHAVIFQGGTVTDLTPTLPSFNDAVAEGINVHGVIVGARSGRAFIWQNGVGTDLNTLIPSGSGVTLTSASGINDSGQIVGIAIPTTGARNAVAFLLTPQ